MTAADPLKQTLLDLDAILAPRLPLILGGGYGLYLKQDELLRSGARTLFPIAHLPDNRTTRDIDLFLRAEIVASAAGMKSVRDALNTLGFAPIAGNEYLQFQKAVSPAGHVKIDLLVGPLDKHFDAASMKRDDRRVRPRAFKNLHAHPVDEAVGIEEQSTAITISGQRSDGAKHTAEVYIAPPFTYLLMKLFAFHDRVDDVAKDSARHHALDAYRVIGLIAQTEDQPLREMAVKHRDHPKVLAARAIVADQFSRHDALGILRMREHPLGAGSLDIDAFIDELTTILPPPTV